MEKSRVAMPVARKRKSPLSIENLRFRQGSLRGKLVSSDGPIPRSVTIRFDGQDVGSVRVRGREPLEGPFTWFVPARHYDGGTHTFEVAVATDDEAPLVLDSLERQMDVGAAPLLHAAAGVNDRGQIEGFAWNSVQPNEPLAIELWERGALIRTIRADQSVSAIPADTAPDACGFAFAPQDLGSWINGRARLIAPKFGEAIPIDFSSVLAEVAVEQVFVDEELAVTVTRPALLAPCDVTVSIDGLARPSRLRERADSIQLFVARPLAEDADHHRLQVAFAFEGETLASAEQTFRWSPPGGLLANPDFRDWQGDRLAVWALEEGYAAMPSTPGDGVSAPFAPALVSLGALGVSGGPLRLAQPVDLSDADAVDLEFIARFEGAAEVQVFDDEGVLAGVIMDGEGVWARHRRTLTLDRPAGPGAHVALLAADADAVELAYLDVGPPGFQRVQSDGQDTLKQGLANGDFQRWSRGLTFQSTGASIETADGWLLSAPKGLKGVRAALVQIESDDGAIDYGFGLKADAPTGLVTLSTQVHPAAVRRGGDWTLELTVQRHPGSARGVARLGRILLSDSPLGGPNAAVLGRDVLLAPDARRVRLSVDAAAWS
ncbi:MAG: hypothetical protein EON87_14920, partial [Brevundimonas sp.]